MKKVSIHAFSFDQALLLLVLFFTTATNEEEEEEEFMKSFRRTPRTGAWAKRACAMADLFINLASRSDHLGRYITEKLLGLPYADTTPGFLAL